MFFFLCSVFRFRGVNRSFGLRLPHHKSFSSSDFIEYEIFGHYGYELFGHYGANVMDYVPPLQCGSLSIFQAFPSAIFELTVGFPRVEDGRVNAFYSTPSIYTDEKFAANESWPLKQDDFFPYADCPHCYWTGYFTSRPALKGFVRSLSNYFMLARQIEFFVRRRPNGPNTDALWDAMAISQHHDAVSGTEKQHVANDYALRLSIAYSEAEQLVNLALGCLVETAANGVCQQAGISFSQCPLLNLSFCPLSESFNSFNESLVVLAYNALGWNRTDYIRIPVNSKYIRVTDSMGAGIPSQLLPISSITRKVRSKYVQGYLGVSPSGSAPAYWLTFPATVPALGYNTYKVSSMEKKDYASASTSKVLPLKSSVTVGPSSLKMVFSEDGLLSAMTDTNNRINVSMQASYLYFEGNPGSDGQGADGAYLFRPTANSATLINTFANVSIVTGPLVHEVWQEFSPWIYQVNRLYKGKNYAEVEYVIGPIPIDDNVGKDVIIRFRSSINSDSLFYTDSNGRDFIKRVRDFRTDWTLEVNEPVAGNYYPINLGMYLKDAESEFSLLVDRALGGASLRNGELEFMLHRRLVHDDGRGVDEALNERICNKTSCEGLTVQGKLFLHVNPSDKGSRWRRSMGQQVYSPLQLAFTTLGNNESWIKAGFPSFSGMSNNYNLPENVALITLQELNDGHTLIRLAHLYELNEDEELSTKAYVNLKNLFPNRQVQSIKEMSLSANQKKSEMKGPLKWKVEEDGMIQQATQRGGPVNDQDLIVELAPIEIRTFLLSLT
ncbi:hypothetical protein L7F22_005615 [Adiantum nelumboides]|nr:hypothetical protein [Adiantum nelumboides]